MKGLYVIFDKIAVEAGPIFEAKNDGVANRAFQKMLIKKENINIEEFELYKVGELNSETMEVYPILKKIEVNMMMETEDE